MIGKSRFQGFDGTTYVIFKYDDAARSDITDAAAYTRATGESADALPIVRPTVTFTDDGRPQAFLADGTVFQSVEDGTTVIEPGGLRRHISRSWDEVAAEVGIDLNELDQDR